MGSRIQADLRVGNHDDLMGVVVEIQGIDPAASVGNVQDPFRFGDGQGGQSHGQRRNRNFGGKGGGMGVSRDDGRLSGGQFDREGAPLDLGNGFGKAAHVDEDDCMPGVGDENVVVPKEKGDGLDLQLRGILGACRGIISMASRSSEPGARAENDKKEGEGSHRPLQRVWRHGRQGS